jgi:hypothetical protein
VAEDERIERQPDERAIDVAVGAVAAATAIAGRAARPALATAEALLALGTQVARAGPADRVVVAAAARGQRIRAATTRRAELVLGDLLRRGVELAMTVLDPTELARRHLDLDALAEVVDVDAVIARVDPGAVASRIDLDELAARIDPDRLAARVDIDAALARLDLVGIVRRAVEAVEAVEAVDRPSTHWQVDRTPEPARVGRAEDPAG